MNMATPEERFNRYLKERYEKERVLQSEVMSATKKERIMTYLTGGLADSTPAFRHKVRRKGYFIERSEGATHLIIPKTAKVKGEKVGRELEVASMDEFYGIINKVHGEIHHVGLNRTYNAVAAKFSGIPRCVIKQFLDQCEICQAKNKLLKNTRAPTGKPTLKKRPFQRCQIDLIDKSKEPDGQYTCIGLFMDHSSRISVLFPLRSRNPDHLVAMLKERVFGYLGLPSILHTDGCPELGSKGLKELVADWPGRTSIIHGRPGHPLTQTLTDSAKKRVDEMLGTMVTTFRKRHPDQPVPWASMLPKVQFQMNTHFNKNLHQSSYEKLYNIPPPEQGLATAAVVEEETWDGVIQDRQEQDTHNQAPSSSCLDNADKSVCNPCGQSSMTSLDGRLDESVLGLPQINIQGSGQNCGQGPEPMPCSLGQSDGHNQAAAMYCYGLAPMDHSYMQ